MLKRIFAGKLWRESDRGGFLYGSYPRASFSSYSCYQSRTYFVLSLKENYILFSTTVALLLFEIFCTCNVC